MTAPSPPPPPPPDRSVYVAKPPRLPARGYALGEAVAGVAAVLLVVVMGGAYGASPIDRLKDFEAPLGLFLVFPAIGGLLGGWFCWRMITRGLPVSWSRALCVALATTALSLLVGCVAGGLVIGLLSVVIGLFSGKGETIVMGFAVIATSVTIVPLFVIWLFGLPFGALTLLWTLAWRFHVNRRAGGLLSPP